MASLGVLCDIVGRYGGAEQYWKTVLPELERRYDGVRLFGRAVEDPEAFGASPAQRIAWAAEGEVPSRTAADRLTRELSGCATVITANVFDPLALAAVRSTGARWIARIHDHRPFCPNGNKLFPQFPAICTVPMGGWCVANSALRGCVSGPRAESVRRIRDRVRTRDVLAGADAIVVSSAYMRDLCIQNRMPAQRIAVTAPPLGDEFFAPVRSPGGNAVLFFGRFNEEKGLASLFRATASITAERRPAIIVAGKGDNGQEKQARALAADLGLDVSWRGWLSQSGLLEAIDEARAVAFPSLWPEPFGLAGTQAQARGRPVVAYDVGGVSDWNAQAGITVPRMNERAFGAALEQLTHDDHVWLRYSHAARTRAQEYRLSEHMNVLGGILQPETGKELVG